MKNTLKIFGIAAALAAHLTFNGNALAQEGGLEGKLGGNQPRQEQLQKDYTEAQAKAILTDPHKFQDEYRSREEKAQEMRFGFKPEHLAHELLDKVRGENDFLRQLVVTYEHFDEQPWGLNAVPAFIASNAIERMTAGDDAYFKKVFNGTENYHIKTAALRQLSDKEKLPLIQQGLSDYGKHTKVVEKHPGEFHYFESVAYFAARDAISSVSDILFLMATANRTNIGDIPPQTAKKRLAELTSDE